ncbi:unnamed protein product, partial [Heligmosomoides polygyrus]|uniref:TAXi_C domain-containing protein n=1 Tax=Heligmosomoides polygyrus TaxID=6339 RepID=A0A183F8N1_HELPZ
RLQYPDGRDDGKPCSVYWFATFPHDFKSIVKSPQSLVNRFPGMVFVQTSAIMGIIDTFQEVLIFGDSVDKFTGLGELAKKVKLTHALRAMQMIFPEKYSFYPRSFYLPADYDEFVVSVSIYT